MAEKRPYLDTPAYMAVLTVVAFWAAASTGNALHARVLAGVCAVGSAANLVRLLVGRRRGRRTAAEDPAVSDS
ncbi:hypothetical protein [Streptomyces sp. DH8]|uniref:hypothetical protein n=1 Tax=Streptomyces sp. DH8 TaxID=2857008 RepID=UPI001E557FAA|nr:hypothetical protein [Streptomyces sp. DH8]